MKSIYLKKLIASRVFFDRLVFPQVLLKFVAKIPTHAETSIMVAINVAMTLISIINIRIKNNINHQAQINFI